MPHDHAEILPDHRIIRRVSDRQTVTRADGRRTLSSLAFKPSTGANAGMSVDIEDWIRAAGKDPVEFVTSPKWVGSIRFRVGDVRAEGCRVGWDPIPRRGSLPANDYHAEVWDLSPSRQKKLPGLAEWFVPIEGVEIT